MLKRVEPNGDHWHTPLFIRITVFILSPYILKNTGYSGMRLTSAMFWSTLLFLITSNNFFLGTESYADPKSSTAFISNYFALIMCLIIAVSVPASLWNPSFASLNLYFMSIGRAIVASTTFRTWNKSSIGLQDFGYDLSSFLYNGIRIAVTKSFISCFSRPQSLYKAHIRSLVAVRLIARASSNISSSYVALYLRATSISLATALRNSFVVWNRLIAGAHGFFAGLAMYVVNASRSRPGPFFVLNGCPWRSPIVESPFFHCCSDLLSSSDMHRFCSALFLLTTSLNFSPIGLCLFHVSDVPSIRALQYSFLRCFASLSMTLFQIDLKLFSLPSFVLYTAPATCPWRCRGLVLESRSNVHPLQPVGLFQVQLWKDLWQPF